MPAATERRTHEALIVPVPPMNRTLRSREGAVTFSALRALRSFVPYVLGLRGCFMSRVEEGRPREGARDATTAPPKPKLLEIFDAISTFPLAASRLPGQLDVKRYDAFRA